MSYVINWRYFSLLDCPLYAHGSASQSYSEAIHDALVPEGALQHYLTDAPPVHGVEAPLLQTVRFIVQNRAPARPWDRPMALAGLGLKVRTFPGRVPPEEDPPTTELILTGDTLILSWPFFTKNNSLRDSLVSAANGLTIPDLTPDEFLNGPHLYLNNALDAGDDLVFCDSANAGTGPEFDVKGTLEQKGQPYGIGNANAVTTPASTENTRIEFDGSEITLRIGRDTSPNTIGGQEFYVDYPCGAITGARRTC